MTKITNNEIDLLKNYGLQITSYVTGDSVRSLRHIAEKYNITIPSKETQYTNIAKLIKLQQ